MIGPNDSHAQAIAPVTANPPRLPGTPRSHRRARGEANSHAAAEMTSPTSQRSPLRRWIGIGPRLQPMER